jgi:hypothetical protein
MTNRNGQTLVYNAENQLIRPAAPRSATGMMAAGSGAAAPAA